jgi:hypothetical protein
MSNRDVTRFKFMNHYILFVKQGFNMIQIFELWDLVCQTGIKHDSNMLFRSWEAWHILPTYEQILTIIHH